MNGTFNALLNEASFTNEILCAGASQIRNANYASKGIYFQSFVSLSTGLERIGKLCLMLDYYIQSGGSFPDLSSMKNEIGHKLILLHEKSKRIITDRAIVFQFSQSFPDPIQESIISVLHGFAEGDRYSNINYLAGSSKTSDPIARWYREVDIPIFELCVTSRKKGDIEKNAAMIAKVAQSWAVVFHFSETGSEITDFEEASIRTGIYEAVSPFRQLYVLQIIRYWVELLGELEWTARNIGKQEIPYFSEIFAMFYNDDEFFRTATEW